MISEMIMHSEIEIRVKHRIYSYHKHSKVDSLDGTLIYRRNFAN